MESRTHPSDVVVIGGGIVGLAVAYRLGREKLRVTLVERGAVGREASWAAAGYLTFQGSSTRPGPRLDLTRASFEMYEAWLDELAEYTPADTGFWRCGLLELCLSEEEAAPPPGPEAPGARRPAFPRGRSGAAAAAAEGPRGGGTASRRAGARGLAGHGDRPRG